MRLHLERFKFSEKTTIGKLSIDGNFWCYTLEDTDRHLEDGGEKIFAKTAIPRGSYKIVIDYSNRFKTDLPRLLDVPQFEGIRIHPGNKSEDTEGCILVGSSYTDDWLYNSRATFNRLLAYMDEFYSKGIDITIDVT